MRAEVPSYADPFRGEMGRNIENAVTLALGGFLALASGGHGCGGPAASFGQVAEAAYALGRGEARSGRTMDALLSAYRVGARVAWRDLSDAGGRARACRRDTVARFAELVFAYIDELSAASAAGHTDELATAGRVRQRYLERLTQACCAAARPTPWRPRPTGRTGRRRGSSPPWCCPDVRARGRARAASTRGTLQPTEQVPGLEDRPELTVLLVPTRAGGLAAPCCARWPAGRRWSDRPGPWLRVRESYERAMRALGLGLPRAARRRVDTEEHLPS